MEVSIDTGTLQMRRPLLVPTFNSGSMPYVPHPMLRVHVVWCKLWRLQTWAFSACFFDSHAQTAPEPAKGGGDPFRLRWFTTIRCFPHFPSPVHPYEVSQKDGCNLLQSSVLNVRYRGRKWKKESSIIQIQQLHCQSSHVGFVSGFQADDTKYEATWPS